MGASLLAIGPSHSTLMLNDGPLSRAGSLPQGVAYLRVTGPECPCAVSPGHAAVSFLQSQCAS
ncbi:hypothetical protein C4E44_11100 [Pseudomonas sp. MWU12-2312b]|nr:hypothetical protein C4E44_11100 [Pseudomonas sp. MWU12-2312b]